MVINLKRLAVSVLLPLAVGGAAGLITRGSVERYADIAKPPLSPPGWLFPVVWTVLYILMGVAFYLVWQSDSPSKPTAFRFYFIQLAMNFVWPILFFNLGAYGFSFLWIVILWIFILLTTLTFYKADKRAGYLMLPYLLWVAFAAYLNFGVYILN